MNGLSEFVIDYEFNGNKWSFSIYAKDKLEAESKLSSIRESALIFGEVNAD